MNFEVLILAAGQSKRFGSPKQLALFKGRTLLERAIALANCLGKKPLVALGANQSLIYSNQDIKNLFSSDADALDVENWMAGMSESVKAGVGECINRQADGVLILLVDQPLITEADLAAILRHVQLGHEQIICADYGDGVGVPAYFSRHYFKDLLDLEGDMGARKVIAALPHISVTVPAEHRADIDTLDDLNRMRETKKAIK